VRKSRVRRAKLAEEPAGDWRVETGEGISYLFGAKVGKNAELRTACFSFPQRLPPQEKYWEKHGKILTFAPHPFTTSSMHRIGHERPVIQVPN
jgi:hypothetical protein